MRKRLGTILTASGATALAISLSATSVLASTASTWTVTPGGSLSGVSNRIVLTDTKMGSVLTCTSSTAAGTAKSGSGLTNPLATLSKVTFANCTGPAGLTYSLQASDFPWPLNGTSYSSGVAKGTISKIHASLKGTDNNCTATIDGTTATADNGMVVVKHNNTVPKNLVVLASGGNLHAYHVTSVLCLLRSGDPITISTTYTLTKGQTISSP